MANGTVVVDVTLKTGVTKLTRWVVVLWSITRCPGLPQ